MTQPEYIDNDGCVRNTVPYIGKTDQEFRFFFFDRWPDIRKKSFSFNPSFKRICELVDIYSEMFGCDPGSPSTLFKLANIAR
jgi:hypothetical protein